MWKGTVCMLGVLLNVLPYTETYTTTNVKDVFTYLFTTNAYNKRVRPVVNHDDATNVLIDFYLTGITAFNEQEESLTTSGYLLINWEDPDLKWTPSTYNEVDSIFIPQDEIWKPDISLRNTFKTIKGLGSTYYSVYVDSEGTVSWSPFQILTSTCSVDITYFPFDVQTCSLKFMAWSYTNTEVNVTLGNNGTILDDFETNSAWDLIDTSAESHSETNECAVVFYLRLKRKPLFYLLNVIVPVLMLSVLSVFTFLLPIDSGERASYGITVFLSLAVFLTIVSSTLPKNSDTTSLLAIYLMSMISLSTLAVLITLIELRLSQRNTKQHPIGYYLRLVYRVSCFMRCDWRCTNEKVSPTDENQEDDGKATPVEDDVDWKTVIAAFDFFGFWLFFLATFLCTTIIFLPMQQVNN